MKQNMEETTPYENMPIFYGLSNSFSGMGWEPFAAHHLIAEEFLLDFSKMLYKMPGNSAKFEQ